MNQLNFKIKFSHPQKALCTEPHHTLHRTTPYDVLNVQRGETFNERVCRISEKRRKSKVNLRRFWVYISRIWGKPPVWIDP